MGLSSSSNYNGVLSYNGVHYPAGQPLLTADNRGFRYGDGLFETMFVQGGRIRLSEYHFERLLSGMALLDFEIPPFFAEKLTKEQLNKTFDMTRQLGNVDAIFARVLGEAG